MDQTIAMFSDPYHYIMKNCKKRNSDHFETRIFFKKTVCLTGQNAAEEVFYNDARIIRHGASPGMLKATLLGKGGVQDLDGREHRHRKAMFMSIMTDENIKELGEVVSLVWERRLPEWAASDEIIFYNEMQLILTEAVCMWAGVPLDEADIPKKRKELTALFDAAGSKNIFRHLFSRYSRKKLDQWMMGIIRDVRKLSTSTITPIQVIALHRDLKGKLLDEHTAAVEALNIIRPVIAVSLFMTFTAHAMILHPSSKAGIASQNENYINSFVNEVRRLYPFFPTAIGKVRESFIWRGQEFKKDMQVLFDIYGTNHDPKVFDHPNGFYPERFNDTKVTLFNFLPQGGGTHDLHHRCPGEFITVELMKVAMNFLATKIDYQTPNQDLSIDFKRTPAMPKDRVILTGVKEAEFKYFLKHQTENFEHHPYS